MKWLFGEMQVAGASFGEFLTKEDDPLLLRELSKRTPESKPMDSAAMQARADAWKNLVKSSSASKAPRVDRGSPWWPSLNAPHRDIVAISRQTWKGDGPQAHAGRCAVDLSNAIVWSKARVEGEPASSADRDADRGDLAVHGAREPARERRVRPPPDARRGVHARRGLAHPRPAREEDRVG